MKSKKRTIGILIVVIVLLLGFAGSLLIYRNKLSSEKTKTNSNNNAAQSISSAPSGKSIENFYDKPITDEKIALDSIEVNRDKLGYSDKNFTFIYDEKSGSETAYHFDLYYKDIPVYGKGVGVFTHYSDNSANVLMSSVSDAEKIIKVNTISKITEDEALDIAKETLGEKFSEYNIGVGFKQIKVSPRLIIYQYNNEYNLVYYIQSGFYMCVINAENGDIIEYHSTEMANSAEYEGQKGDIHTVFYENYKDENYDIKNALWNRDKSLFIFDNCIDSISLNYILKLDDIKDGNNKSAVDGMANTYRAIEYFEQENFDLSFNNTWVIVNNDKSKDENGRTRKDNATGQVYFVGEKPIAKITFDLRSKKNNVQLSAYLDIVGHEYTHAVTGLKCFGSSGYNTDSKYFEQNALMEAYSDIFGQLIEQKYTGKTDWIQSVPDNSRDLKKTKTYSKRQKTKDDKGTEKNGYGYAHNNSTIISHTAFLMSKDNRNSKYNNDILLDYDQLGQLWYGSLEYLKKTEFKDFADCRYAVEESARKLIEDGVLLEDNLKVIEQAFNEVGVSSNPARRGAIDSVEIKEKHTETVPIEQETESTQIDLTVNVNSTYIGEITKDSWTCYYTLNISEDSSLFTVQTITSDGIEGGFDLPITKVENGVYFYTNGSAYDRSQTGGRINIVNGLNGTITVNNDGSLMWKTEDSLPYELKLTAYSTMANQEANTNNFNISDYNGMFYPNDSNINAYIIIDYQSEKNANIEINISNSKATYLSQVFFSGNVDNSLLIFEDDDGFGRNSYTLEFFNQKVYLTAKCIESYGIWGIPELNKLELTKQSEIIETQIKDIPISDIEILWAVNKYLEENKGHLGTWLTVSDAPYCPTEHMYSNDKNWSCPINLSWESYSSNEIAGAYPHFAYVNKETLKCTLTANYETVVEFDLKEYIK